VARDFPGAHRQ
jgi:transposase